MQLRSIAWPTLVVGIILGGLFAAGIATGLWLSRQTGAFSWQRLFTPSDSAQSPGTLSVLPPTGSVSSSIPEVIERTKPAVVTVAIRQQIQQQVSPFDLFFGAPIQETPNEPVQQDIGSGFVVDTAAGLVVTNRHVVSNANAEYVVIDSEGQEHPVKQMYRDPINDLSILQIEAQLPSLPLGDSDTIRIGEPVIAIGTALGEFRQTVTSGIVSGVGRGIEAQSGWAVERIDNLIQTDAAINPGNSGGPLLNDRGEVIGVNVAVARAENIGFALPISAVRASLDNFKQTGEFSRAYLGIQYRLISLEAALTNQVPAGAYVTQVLANSPAAQSGLQNADIITKISERSIVDTPGGVAGILNALRVGDTVTVEFWRRGQTSTVDVTLKELPEL